jgi:hypothetical protein
MGMAKGMVAKPASPLQGIPEETFLRLLSLQAECSRVSTHSTQGQARLRHDFCKAFDRAVAEGRNHQDTIGLMRLRQHTPDRDRKRANSLERAIKDVQSRIGNKERDINLLQQVARPSVAQLPA